MLSSRPSIRLASRAIRAYSAAATSSASFNASTVPSGVKVVSFEDGSPLTTLSVVLPAGSRFEPADASGVAHYLKAYAFKNTEKRTGFRLCREAELQGATLSAELGRETLAYSARLLRTDLPYFVEALAESLLHPRLADHEHAAVTALVAQETATFAASPPALLLDTLHRAAFRHGLGNSLYAHQAISPAQVRDYLRARLGAGIAVVANGADHASLSSLVASTFPSTSVGTSTPTPTPSTFHAQEERVFHPGAGGEFALAWDVHASRPAAAVLTALLGVGPRVKWGEGASPLAALSTSLAPSASTVHASLLPYSDATLLALSASGPQATEAIQGALAALRALAAAPPSAQELGRAVRSAKFDRAAALERGPDRLLSLVSDAGLGLPRTPFPAYAASLDALAPTDLQALAKALLASRPATAAVGNLRTLPYASDLGF